MFELGVFGFQMGKYGFVGDVGIVGVVQLGVIVVDGDVVVGEIVGFFCCDWGGEICGIVYDMYLWCFCKDCNYVDEYVRSLFGCVL